MSRSLMAVSLSALLLLGGCTWLNGQVDDQTGAPPIKLSDYGNGDPQLPDVLKAIDKSYSNCESYKRRLLFGSRSFGFGFDVLTTIFSALGTAFVPVDTVHAFTAAATISSGSKTALDADVYQNATAPLMAEALSASYDKDMDDLLQQLRPLNSADNPPRTPADSASNPPGTSANSAYYRWVLVRVQNINGKCSLSEALVQLQKLETQANPVAPAQTGPAATSSDAPKTGAQSR